ncbi:MAG: efflux RND transporter periplasmic adaptor subunit [Candidatus Krumholzibacteria bacterium]|nr:efflux RND transporter periplasmic adaptor subunit [Candidatus Krumholzibacteria bacterium]
MKRKRMLTAAVAVAAVAVVLAVPASRRAVLGFFDLGTQRAATDSYYTCPMHPEIRLPQPGDCPICGMSLVQKKAGDEDESGVVAVTPRQVQLAGITVAPVEVRALSRAVDAYGKIDYDETRLAVVSAWIGGRIDKLYIDFTGVTVDKGHALAWLYSPELISTGNEFLLAVRNQHSIEASGRADAAAHARALVESSRQRLLRWGLTRTQVDHIAETGQVEDHITIYAPQGGTVIEKRAFEGMYVKEGDVLFRVADLHQVWMHAEIYEDDISFLYQEREGDYYECLMHPEVRSPQPGACPKCGMDLVRMNDAVKAEITTRSFAGEAFEGQIAFTAPVLDPQTRTVRARVNIANREQKLKPNMYARASIRLPAGDVLAVPENAVLQSGSRTIVLVEEAAGRFRPQPVRLGRMWLDDAGREREERRELVFKREALRYHEVLAGLEPGERVVTSGNFLLGSESQLQGALARMLEASEDTAAADQPQLAALEFEPEPALALDAVLTAYYRIAGALTGDRLEGIGQAAGAIVEKAASAPIRAAAEPLRHAEHGGDIEGTRAHFQALSDVLIAYVRAHRGALAEVPLQAYCPMKDAYWLQAGGELLNPYYGSKMLYCGKFVAWDAE